MLKGSEGVPYLHTGTRITLTRAIAKMHMEER